MPPRVLAANAPVGVGAGRTRAPYQSLLFRALWRFMGPVISSILNEPNPDLLPQSFENVLHFLLAVVEGVVRGDLGDRNLPSCLCNVLFRYTFALQ